MTHCRHILPLAAIATMGACGMVLDPEGELEQILRRDQRPGITAAADDDCAENLTLSEFIAADTGPEPELHLIAVAEPRSLIAGQATPGSDVTVRVDRGGPSKLVLASRRETHWHIIPGGAADIVQVTITGPTLQTVTVAGDSQPDIVDLTAPTAGFVQMLGDGYIWPSSDSAPQCERFFLRRDCKHLRERGRDWRRTLAEEVRKTLQFIQNVEADQEGQPISTFHGCYAMSELTLVDDHAR